MGHEPRITKLLAWCLLIATTVSFGSSIYAQWLEGETLEMRQLVSKPMPNWWATYAKDDPDDAACADVPHASASIAAKPTPEPAAPRAAEPAFLADVRDPY